jgi:hypothetical protein
MEIFIDVLEKYIFILDDDRRASSSETSLDVYQTKLGHILEASNILQNIFSSKRFFFIGYIIM